MGIGNNIKSKIEITKSFYKRYERIIPVISFFAGFTWDSITLTRIDQIFDNLIILLYLVLLGGTIILVVFIENGLIKKHILLKYSEWYPAIIQFFFGGLFSTYVVFYFQSASFTKTSLFLIVLVCLLIANEFLQNRLTNLYLILSLYFLAVFSFFIFFLPVVFQSMNTFVYLVSGIISLIFIGVFIFLFRKKDIFKSRQKFKFITTMIFSLYLVLNIFYFMNWIPPVPLSMKDAGIYHQVIRTNDIYILKQEKPKWYQFFKTDDSDFNYIEGDTVYCFTAIFAPTDLSKKILHHWQYYSEEKAEWVTTDRRGYELYGGREGGYRGFTYKKNVKPGEWRINIITDDELMLGRINFDISKSELYNHEWEVLLK